MTEEVHTSLLRGTKEIMVISPKHIRTCYRDPVVNFWYSKRIVFLLCLCTGYSVSNVFITSIKYYNSPYLDLLDFYDYYQETMHIEKENTTKLIRTWKTTKSPQLENITKLNTTKLFTCNVNIVIATYKTNQEPLIRNIREYNNALCIAILLHSLQLLICIFLFIIYSIYVPKLRTLLIIGYVLLYITIFLVASEYHEFGNSNSYLSNDVGMFLRRAYWFEPKRFTNLERKYLCTGITAGKIINYNTLKPIEQAIEPDIIMGSYAPEDCISVIQKYLYTKNVWSGFFAHVIAFLAILFPLSEILE